MLFLISLCQHQHAIYWRILEKKHKKIDGSALAVSQPSNLRRAFNNNNKMECEQQAVVLMLLKNQMDADSGKRSAHESFTSRQETKPWIMWLVQALWRWSIVFDLEGCCYSFLLWQRLWLDNTIHVPQK